MSNPFPNETSDVDYLAYGEKMNTTQANKSLWIGIIVFILAILLVVAIVLIVIFVVIQPNSAYVPYTIPRSAQTGELLVLQDSSSLRSDGSPRVVARSYDGFTWEAISDQDFAPVVLSCVAGTCSVITKGRYSVREVTVPAQLKSASNEAKASKFLQQATFGGTRAEITALVATVNNFAAWIAAEVAKPITYLRQYVRARQNPPQSAVNHIGAVVGVCDVGSRWQRNAFGVRDEREVVVVANNEAGINRFTLRVNGILYTELSSFFGVDFPGTGAPNITFPASFRICNVAPDESVGSTIRLSNSTLICDPSSGWNFPNPSIEFTNIDTQVTQSFNAGEALFTPLPVPTKSGVLFANQFNVPCLGRRFGNIAFFGIAGVFYRYDPRLKLIQNSIEAPANVLNTGGSTCPSVSKNFVNAGSCIRRSSCSAVTFSSQTMTLDDPTLRYWFTQDNRYVYYITGLRLEDPYAISPCSGVSRWRRLGTGPCTETAGLDPVSVATIRTALSTSLDTNAFVRNIQLSGANCTNVAAGAIVLAGGECFQHVHPHLFDVRDATYWAVYAHPGNMVAAANGNPNPIKKWANQGLVGLTFPWHHGMDRWADNNAKLPLVGRYGDQIDFRSLNTQLQTFSMATRVGAVNVGNNDTSVETCGSRSETQNNPVLGHLYQTQDNNGDYTLRTEELDYRYSLVKGKTMGWMNGVLNAPDQLRHRVAWALAQIFTVSEEGLGREAETEVWNAYYDIFVKNAFGNYFDILKEVSYSPLMAEYLSFLQNRAFAFSRNYPDENYAREIMQLFSIGLWKLNQDGSQVLDYYGNPIDTYSNDDIVVFARVWTGFDYQLPRGNLEAPNGPQDANTVDPMQIKPRWRDYLPKAKLEKGFLGDEYPLCDELPSQHWLKPGARYVFTGSNSAEGKTMDAENAADVGKRGRFTPAVGVSQLYARLCAPDVSGRCSFPPEVVLTAPLTCNGQECNAERVVSVKIVDPVANTVKYYTYVPLPCVRLAFFNQGRITKNWGTQRQCANPKSVVATPVCCLRTRTNSVQNVGAGLCQFANEAVTFDTASKRCNDAGFSMCDDSYTGSATWDRSCAASVYQWINNTCTVKVQVYLSGLVGIVDPAAAQFNIFQESSFNNFRVRWNGGFFPLAPNCPASCRAVPTPLGASCLCDFKVTDRVFFTNPTLIPSVDEIAASLYQGSVPPQYYGAGAYVRCTTPQCLSRVDVNIWLPAGRTTWDKDTIFELDPVRIGGRRRYLLNRESVVSIEGFSFRNPPAFLPILGEQVNVFVEWSSDSLWIPRCEQEVEALLLHLFEHPNTAPFVAFRLIQRLGVSNPSPRYVTEVVKAFNTGAYNGQIFSGKYGDLQAAVYAVLLDREARSTVLEADPRHGALREPLLKVMSMFRSLAYAKRSGAEIIVDQLSTRIGMEPFSSPTVFGFYLPHNRPEGPVTNNGLLSPEAQIATSPNIIGYLNGVTSLIDNGLTFCGNGFGQWWHPTIGGRRCSTRDSALFSDGDLSYVPASTVPKDIVDDLALLLTADHMTPETRQAFVTEYITVAQQTSAANALKRVLKLFVISADFHTTTANIITSIVRPDAATIAGRNGVEYKAIIIIFQAGGADSYNLIVPHSGCTNGDYYAQYNTVRQGAAVPKTLIRPINTPAGSQICTTFGVHPSMPILHGLYNSGEAAFLANIGALVEPVTTADYKGTSGRPVKMPPSLFAHNVMQRSMHNLHAQNAAAKGILGRTINAVRQQNYKSQIYSLMGNVKMVEGSIPPYFVDRSSGIQRFTQYAAMTQSLRSMSEFQGISVFGETYNSLLSQAISQSESVGGLLQTVTVDPASNFDARDSFAQQLQQVAKIIKMRKDPKIKTDRDVFIVSTGGWDTHNTFDLDSRYGQLDKGLSSFVREMKSQGEWNNVVILSVSDFGRTLTSNGQGTDHAWGGNHFVLGGKVKGGQIFGKYPSGLTDDSELNIGRGRVIPSTPWEYIWFPIAQWFGVQPIQMGEVLPNAQNFAGNLLQPQNVFNP